MKDLWAKIWQMRGVVGGIIAAVLVLAVIVGVVASHAGVGGNQTGANVTHGANVGTDSLSTPAATDTPPPTPAPTATSAPTATATHPPAPTPTATATPFPGKIVRVTNVSDWTTPSVSVTCPAGTTLVGGGEDNGAGTSGQVPADVQSSYPSGGNTWEAKGHTAANVTESVTVVADCLQSTTPVTTTYTTISSPTSSYLLPTGAGSVALYDVRCPHGVVTGGGYLVTSAGGYAIDSHPDGANGWVSSVFNGALTAYAICASAPLSVKVVSRSITYPKFSGTDLTVIASGISCPSGSAPLSGGFGEPRASNIQVGTDSSYLDPSGLQWDITGADKFGGADEIGAIYALCARLA